LADVYELSRGQKAIVCSAMADYSNKVERKLDRLREKTLYHIGSGETISANRERDRTFNELKICLETMNILRCG